MSYVHHIPHTWEHCDSRNPSFSTLRIEKEKNDFSEKSKKVQQQLVAQKRQLAYLDWIKSTQDT